MTDKNIGASRYFQKLGFTVSLLDEELTLPLHRFSEVKQAIQQELLKARIDEISILRNGYGWGDALETSEYILDDRLDDLQAKLKGDDK